MIIDGSKHTVEKGIHTDVLLEYMNEWLEERPYQGIIAVEITHCRRPTQHLISTDKISFYFNYINRPEFHKSAGNTAFYMPLKEYKRRVRIKKRNKSINKLIND